MTTYAPNATLIDAVWPQPSERSKALARAATAIVGFALLTAVLAQFEVTLGFTPVPITGQTLGVLLAGGALGLRAGAASQALYWLLGMIGLPFYAGGDGGWQAATGATMGYFVGFVAAAALIGYLAQRGETRNLVTSMAAMAFGSFVIYAIGATWLAHSLDVPLASGEPNAISLGVTPFLIGDAIKLVLAGALLPAAWKLVDRTR
jgi:biotin transport system substrate-specific component